MGIGQKFVVSGRQLRCFEAGSLEAGAYAPAGSSTFLHSLFNVPRAFAPAEVEEAEAQRTSRRPPERSDATR